MQMWTEQELGGIRALDGQIKALAKKVWAKHPNNPNNKAAK